MGRPREHAERITGIHPIREALRARRRPLDELRLRAPGRGGHAGLAELAGLARAAGVAVTELSGGAADKLESPGAELRAGPLPELELETLLVELPPEPPRLLVALDGVEDPQNLGAIARVAEGAGASALLLTRRHAPPLSPAVSRASAGAIEWLPVARVSNLARALESLQKEGFWSLGADPAAGTSLFELPESMAAGDRVLVLGAEGRGLRPGVAARVDHPIAIPLGGHVESLNVSAAAAVVLFELRRRAAGPREPRAG